MGKAAEWLIATQFCYITGRINAICGLACSRLTYSQNPTVISATM